MDGVLTDFQREMMRLHQPHTLKYEDIQWNFWPQMGKTKEEFWKVADRAFWANMPWTPEGQKLLANLERLVGRKNITLLTSPGIGGLDGKEDWIRANIPEYRNQFFMGHEKWRVANPNTLLVDDSDQNCIAYSQVGGPFVMVPRPWNLYKGFTNKDGSFKMRPLMDAIRKWWEE
jgi:hypothetical protein